MSDFGFGADMRLLRPKNSTRERVRWQGPPYEEGED